LSPILLQRWMCPFPCRIEIIATWASVVSRFLIKGSSTRSPVFVVSPAIYLYSRAESLQTSIRNASQIIDYYLESLKLEVIVFNLTKISFLLWWRVSIAPLVLWEELDFSIDPFSGPSTQSSRNRFDLQLHVSGMGGRSGCTKTPVFMA
jgi:hypothetical protein